MYNGFHFFGLLSFWCKESEAKQLKGFQSKNSLLNKPSSELKTVFYRGTLGHVVAFVRGNSGSKWVVLETDPPPPLQASHPVYSCYGDCVCLSVLAQTTTPSIKRLTSVSRYKSGVTGRMIGVYVNSARRVFDYISSFGTVADDKKKKKRV